MRYLQGLSYGIKVTIHCYPFVLDHLDFTHEDLAPVRKSVFHWITNEKLPIYHLFTNQQRECVVLRETFVQLGNNFRAGAITPICYNSNVPWNTKIAKT